MTLDNANKSPVMGIERTVIHLFAYEHPINFPALRQQSSATSFRQESPCLWMGECPTENVVRDP
jgi:hypothetical protein